MAKVLTDFFKVLTAIIGPQATIAYHCRVDDDQTLSIPVYLRESMALL